MMEIRIPFTKMVMSILMILVGNVLTLSMVSELGTVQRWLLTSGSVFIIIAVVLLTWPTVTQAEEATKRIIKQSPQTKI